MRELLRRVPVFNTERTRQPGQALVGARGTLPDPESHAGTYVESANRLYRLNRASRATGFFNTCFTDRI